MGSKYVKRDDIDRKGMSPEQLAILVVMLGFIIIAVGMYITQDILSIYFEIGMVIIIFGTCLYSLMIYARIYSLEHIPIPLPETLKDFLTHGTFRQQERRGPAPKKHEPRIAMMTRTTPTYAQPSAPAKQTETMAPQPSPWAGPSPYSTAGTSTSGASGQTADTPAPEPAVIPAPIEKAVPETPMTPAPKPEPKKEKFVDVLEEADKEFESYIDKLIEE